MRQQFPTTDFVRGAFSGVAGQDFTPHHAFSGRVVTAVHCRAATSSTVGSANALYEASEQESCKDAHAITFSDAGADNGRQPDRKTSPRMALCRSACSCKEDMVLHRLRGHCACAAIRGSLRG